MVAINKNQDSKTYSGQILKLKCSMIILYFTRTNLSCEKPQYPVAENGFEFQESLVEALYSLNIWDRLRAFVNVLKLLSDQQNSPPNRNRRND